MNNQRTNILVNHNIKVYNKMLNIIENLNPNLNIKITNIPSLENNQFYFSFSISNKKFYTIMSNFSTTENTFLQDIPVNNENIIKKLNLINIEMVGNDKNNIYRLLKIFVDIEELSEYFISKYVKIENISIKYDEIISEKEYGITNSSVNHMELDKSISDFFELKPIYIDKNVDTNDLYENNNTNNLSINLLDLEYY
jgi:hypothetical protein